MSTQIGHVCRAARGRKLAQGVKDSEDQTMHTFQLHDKHALNSLSTSGLFCLIIMFTSLPTPSKIPHS